jgi:uncharacterized protein YeaO (DUF488 family)
VRKHDLPIDRWAKEIAPSNELRRWFGHEPKRWAEFARRYRRELGHGPAADALAELTRHARSRNLTIVYSARDPHHNNAVVVRGEIQRRLAG